MHQIWHHKFGPRHFLQRIKVATLLRKNELFAGTGLVPGTTLCVLCRGFSGTILVLNDKRVLCKPCFERLAWIRYPERYERLWREYQTAMEARRQARNLLIAKSVSRRVATAAVTIGVISVLLALAVHWAAKGSKGFSKAKESKGKAKGSA